MMNEIQNCNKSRIFALTDFSCFAVDDSDVISGPSQPCIKLFAKILNLIEFGRTVVDYWKNLNPIVEIRYVVVSFVASSDADEMSLRFRNVYQFNRFTS